MEEIKLYWASTCGSKYRRWKDAGVKRVRGLQSKAVVRAAARPDDGMPKATVVLSADAQAYLHQYGILPRLITECDDVVTETDHRLHGGAGAPGLG